jgi:hypothetical protein
MKNTVSTGFPEEDRARSKKRVISIVLPLQGKDQNCLILILSFYQNKP